MSSEVNPQEVVDVVFPGGTVGRTTREHAGRAGLPIVADQVPQVVETPAPAKATRGPRKTKPSVEADENTD